MKHIIILFMTSFSLLSCNSSLKGGKKNKEEAPQITLNTLHQDISYKYDTLFSFNDSFFVEYNDNEEIRTFHGIISRNTLLDSWEVDNFYCEIVENQNVYYDNSTNGIKYEGSIGKGTKLILELKENSFTKQWYVINEAFYIQDESKNNIPILVDSKKHKIDSKVRFNSIKIDLNYYRRFVR